MPPNDKVRQGKSSETKTQEKTVIFKREMAKRLMVSLTEIQRSSVEKEQRSRGKNINMQSYPKPNIHQNILY